MSNGRTIALDKANAALRAREQELVDMCYAIAMHYETLAKMPTNEARAEWVRYQLGVCGFVNEPMGMSWGVLKE